MPTLVKLARGTRQRWWRARLAIRRAVPRRRSGVVLHVTGARWFVSLFTPEFTLLGQNSTRVRRRYGGRTHSERTTSGVLVAIAGPGSSSTDDRSPTPAPDGWSGFRVAIGTPLDDRPFIQPLVMNPSARRPFRARSLPDDFARLAADARRTVGAPPPAARRRADPADWLTATAVAHRRYRTAHTRTATDVVDEALGSHTGSTSRRPRSEVTIVCATRRPHQLGNIIANYERQTFTARRLVVVTNSSTFDRNEVERRIGAVHHGSVIHLDEEASLGACLNAALAITDSRYIAKFDDDDRYGAEYLTDALIAHRFARAGVVGKHSHFACFEGEETVHLRFPGREFEYTSWIAGGTLVADRDHVGDLQFRDLSIGEDGAFLSDCQRAGHAVYAADRFNYVQLRHDENTWQQARRQYLRDAVELAPTSMSGTTEL